MSTDKEPEIGTQENTNSKKAGKSSYGYIFILYVQSFLIVFGGQILGMVVMVLLSAAGMFATAILSEFLHVSFSPIDESSVWITGMEYAVFVGICMQGYSVSEAFAKLSKTGSCYYRKFPVFCCAASRKRRGDHSFTHQYYAYWSAFCYDGVLFG